MAEPAVENTLSILEVWLKTQIGPTWFRITYSNITGKPVYIAWVERCGYTGVGHSGPSMAEVIMRAIHGEDA